MEKLLDITATEKEQRIQKAIEKYFALYLNDWAESKQLQPRAIEELKDVLLDFYFFAEDYVQEEEITADTEISEHLLHLL